MIDPILKAQANGERTAFVAESRSAQAAWLSDPEDGRARYLQLPVTAANPPGQAEPPQTTGKPPHRGHGWPELKARGYAPPAKLRTAFEVHEYVAPGSSPGWYVIQRVRDGGDVYLIIENGAGLEEYRTMKNFVLVEVS